MIKTNAGYIITINKDKVCSSWSYPNQHVVNPTSIKPNEQHNIWI